MTKDEALKLALDALEESTDTERTYESFERGDIAITAIKDVLAQPEQEPVAKYIGECSEGSLVQLYDDVKKGTPLYASPPKREWVGLTHEQHIEIMTGNMTTSSRIAATEEKLKELNT